MMNRIKVSIVIPVYNVEKYLDRCVNSVINQTYSNIEIILVDDGSKDNSGKICDEWEKKDSRIKTIHKKNEGLGMARNTGLDNATGDYIGFVDSDDFIEQKLIEDSVDKIVDYSPDVVMYGLKSLDFLGNLISEDIPKTEKNFFEGEEISNYILPNMIAMDPITKERLGFNMSASGGLYNLKLIKDCNWKFVSERKFISEDFYSLLNLYSYINKVYVINDAYYNYCFNDKSLTHTFNSKRYIKICECYKSMFENAKKIKYPNVVLDSLYSQCLGSIIFTMKQMMVSELNFFEIHKEISDIVNDDFLRELIQNLNYENESRNRKIFINLLKSKLVLLIYILLKFKS